MKYKTNLILSILLPIQWFLVRWISKYPHKIETYYSEGIYPKIANTLQIIFGRLPFSFGDIFYLTLGVFSIYLLYKCIKEWRVHFVKNMLKITALLSVVYFIFNLFWAINYYRPPLYQQMNLETNYTTEELYKTTQKLISHTNELHATMAFADSIVDSPHSKRELRKLASKGYKQIPEHIIPNIKAPESIKNSLFSLSLSYLGYGGYFNPFTGEAQVNAKVPKTLYAVIAAHEQAHQMGYAAENEANFLGVLASIQNPDKFVQFAGYSYGLRYCLNELARRDKDLYYSVHKTIRPGVLAMYSSHYEFWKQYDTVIESISKNIWDKFLKVSKQEDGITSYSYIVALLVNFDKTEPETFL